MKGFYEMVMTKGSVPSKPKTKIPPKVPNQPLRPKKS